MFVRKSTYEDERERRIIAEIKLEQMISKWNALVDKINKKGGEQFLECSLPKLLDKDDVTKLITLCHPDKHDNNKIANDMTIKLLQLRDVI